MSNNFASLLKKAQVDSDSELLFLRIGLAAAGGLLLFMGSYIDASAPATLLPGDVFLLIAAGILGLGLIGLAGLRRPTKGLRWLVLIACLTVIVLRSILWVQTPPSADLTSVDQGYYTDFAGQVLLRGQNPYAWDLSGAFDLYRGDKATSTPLLNGASEQVYPYPALPFLLVTPLQAVGLPGVLSLSILFQAALLVLLFVASPRPMQPLVLLPVVVGTDFTGLALLGTLDVVWIVLLVGMVMTWRRPPLAAILFGAAAAAKQSPWVLAPFLLIRIWREPQNGMRLKHLAQFVGFSSAVFLITNLPFILWNPAAWLTGATEPLRDDMVFFSQGGLASLTELGWVNLPKAYYLLATVTVLVVLLFVFWRHYVTLRDAVWVMPGMVMWFSYRNLITYWAPWGLVLIAAIVTGQQNEEPADGKPSWAPTLGITGATAGALVFAGILLSSAPAPIGVLPRYPLLTTNGQVMSITLQVENHSLRPITPRFSVQKTSASFNPLAWHIDEGPLTIPGRQSATFRISPENPADSFYVHEQVQIIVTDADGDYGLRGSASIGPDPSFLWPDAIPNPGFLFWDQASHTPIFWSYEPGTSSNQIGLVQKGGKNALMIDPTSASANSGRIGLENWIIFPDRPFGLWVYAEPRSALTYGIELDDGTHRLQILFDRRNSSEVANGTLILNRSVPEGQWSYQVIDFPSIYAQAGWPTPAPTPSVYRTINADLSLVMLHLFASSPGGQGDAQAYFGPIVQDYGVNSQALMASTLDDPVGYYMRLADSYVQERNYGRAIEAYQRALVYAPGNAEAIEGMKKAEMANAASGQ